MLACRISRQPCVPLLVCSLQPTVWQLLTGVDLSRVGVPRSSAEEAALMTVSEERQAALLAFLGRQQLPRLALVKL